MYCFHALGIRFYLGITQCTCSLRLSSTAVTADTVQQTLIQIAKLQNKYGFDDARFKTVTAKKIIVEYSSPNIAKKFHIGHFRSTIVGHAIANIVELAGHEVTRMNYLGDWGMQFAVLSLGFEAYGDKELLQNSPLRHLFEVYVKANERLQKDPSMKVQAQELFCKMEQGDQKATIFWELCRKISIEEYKKLYTKINIVFDAYETESMYFTRSRNILGTLRENGHLVKLPSGVEAMDISTSSWSPLNKSKTMMTPPLVRSNGTTLYLTRDIAAAVSRYEKYWFDQMIYVTDKAQIEHFIQLFSILELLGNDWAGKGIGALKHVSFGRIISMKTRNGQVVFLEDILDEAFQRTREERLMHSTRKTDITNETEMLRTLALSGLICNDLKRKLTKDYRFSWDDTLQSNGDTGLFLQYTHCRLQSLKRNCGVELNLNVDCSGLVNEQTSLELFLHLSKFRDVAWLAYSELEPSHLVKFMLELARFTAKAHKQLKVKDQELETAQSRLLLFHCAVIVLSNCMKTVGIQPLDKM